MNEITQSDIFGFLNVRSFSPGGFFTFLVALAHGVPCQTGAGIR